MYELACESWRIYYLFRTIPMYLHFNSLWRRFIGQRGLYHIGQKMTIIHAEPRNILFNGPYVCFLSYGFAGFKFFQKP